MKSNIMPNTSYQKDDEVDLSELFVTLWSHKIWIGVITCLSIFMSGYYALTTKKQYTATAIFEIEPGNSNNFNIPGDIGALASVAGFGGIGNSSSEILMERISGREFILNVSQILSLQDDPFFQSYNPNASDPFWKATIKSLVGWEKSRLSKELIIESTIQQIF